MASSTIRVDPQLLITIQTESLGNRHQVVPVVSRTLARVDIKDIVESALVIRSRRWSMNPAGHYQTVVESPVSIGGELDFCRIVIPE